MGSCLGMVYIQFKVCPELLLQSKWKGYFFFKDCFASLSSDELPSMCCSALFHSVANIFVHSQLARASSCIKIILLSKQ